MASVSEPESIFSYNLPLINKCHLKCQKRLGEGGFGEVFKAHHTAYGQDVAVKFCKKHISEDTRKDIAREINRMIKALHDNIIVIRGTVMDPRFCCIVMEYMQHGSLWCFQEKLTHFPDALKVEMIHGITLGMNFLHTQDKPIIHRDLKLDNILVNERLMVKISDFGLATWYTASNFKVPGGTIDHIPPEHLEDANKEATTKFDVYSFAITLWEFASRQRSFKNCNNDALLKLAVIDGQRPDMQLIPNDEPDIVKNLIKECWHQDPAKRPDFKEINQNVDEEFEKKYKKDVNQGRADIYMQLQLHEESPKQEETDETPKFPWEKQGLCFDLTHTDAKVLNAPSPALAPQDDPQTLQSNEFCGCPKPVDEREPVPVAQNDEGRQAGMSGIIAQMTGLKVNGDKYGVTATTPHDKQATPTDCYGSFPNGSEDQAGPFTVGPLQTELPMGQYAHPTQHQPNPNSGLFPSHQYGGSTYATKPEPHKNGGHSQPEQPFGQYPFRPQSNTKSDSFPGHQYGGSTYATKPEPHKNTNVNISIKGDRNIVNVRHEHCTLDVGKNKAKRKSKKKSKRKPPTLPTSSSSSSDSWEETDSVAHTTSISTSNEPVTEAIVRDVSDRIGKKYRHLGSALKLPQPTIENIEMDHEKYGRDEVAFQIMLKWMQSKGKAATKADLAEALVKIGLQNVAEIL